MSFINWGLESPEQLRIRRAMEEQMMFEQAAFNAATAAAAAAGSGGRLAGSFQFVVDTTGELEFRLEFTSTGEPIQFTIDWGDGTIHQDSGVGGEYAEYHTYAEAGQYTGKATFNKPQNVIALDFQGPDDDYATLTSITGLQSLKNLEEFQADWNSLTDVDLSGLAKLTYVDISDCKDPQSGEPCLTNVNLIGCTNLVQLRLDDSDFSGGILDLTGLDSLQRLDLDESGLAGTADLSGLPALTWVDLSSNFGLTEVIITSNQQIGKDGDSMYLTDCSLTSDSVDSILVALSLNGVSGGEIYVGGSNAAPGEVGLLAKEELEANGWTVEVNP